MSAEAMRQAMDRAREALPQFRQQDDWLLSPGASLMSDDSHEIIHVDTLQKIVSAVLAEQPDHHPDDDAVDEFAARLKRKLAASRAKGRSGWREPKWTQAQINEQLHAHLAKGDPLDVAAYTMFLSLREEITTAPVEQPKAETAAGNWRDVVEDALSACRSVSLARDRRIDVNGVPHYLQTEEWCKWLHDEIAPFLVAMLDAPPAPAVPEDSKLLKALMDNHWKVEPFNIATGGDDFDVGWRVIEFHMPDVEREVAREEVDDPRVALRAAMLAAAPEPPK